jgi:large subunit ribosomal protein L17
MRHGNKVNALGRKYGHRKALMTNLAVALITHKRIRTTTAKAKALRGFVEPIINRSKC